jgi:hypothetical protein
VVIEQPVQRFATLVIIEERVDLVHHNKCTRIQTLEARLVGHAPERCGISDDHVRRLGPGPRPLSFQGRAI